MNIEQLRYFQLTASFQHMSKAADVLNISQPALGSNIRRLEIELGVPLFDRVGRNIVLNSYGEEFLKSANSIIDIWSEITIKLKSMRDNNSNTVTFRMPSCYCSLYMAWCEELLSQKPLAYEIRKIVEEYFVSQVNEYES